MFEFITRWLGKRGPAAPMTRLSRDEAIAIARRAAAGDPDCELLTLAQAIGRPGNATWIVSSATVGSALVVQIDDATGQVLTKGRAGIR